MSTNSIAAISRRSFLQATVTAALAASLRAQDKRRPRILLRSSWQTVNIGDIAHTPGVLALLGKNLPEADVSLWPTNIGSGVEEMLRKRFPKLQIVQGAGALKTAFAENDFLLHGSGPSLVAANDVAKWRDQTHKPYGIYGITLSAVDDKTRDLLTGARFVFFRDSVSLKLAQDHGVAAPVMEFGPDGAFDVDVRNDAAAAAFLREHGLKEGQFLCCIPRLRYTPYWKIKDAPFDPKRHERNEAMKEHDHAPLREVITAVLRETSLQVLVCPEDQSQMEVGKEMLVDKLPTDVARRVVWREKYWLTDEALSTYVRSAGLFGLEMHSPIMCIGNGVPAIVCRFAEQTSKGFMWRDIGLGDWLFDMDREADVTRLVPTVLALAKDPAGAKAKAAQAREFVQKCQRRTLDVLKKNLA